ncbi:MAG: ribose-phosphate diphosphokinase [Spirochaetaceae bacterium]|jgi:ribose-phosphate pyrophosphokinase|nr:ribose-phosphate diphosphokinase [Spirochaetaceae bacterium]
MHKEFVITATRSVRSYASRVVEYLVKFPSFSPLSDAINGVKILDTDRFADGEMEAVVNASIRGKDVVLFTSCARNEAGISVEEAKIELYHTVDALKRSQAGEIIIFEPFVSCSRSDRTARRSSVGLWVHLKILTSLGATHIVTYQLHSDKSKSMLDPTISAIDDVPALTLLKRYLCDAYIQSLTTLEQVVRPHWAFCSVDAGGEKLARDFANSFGAPLVVAHKQRDYSKANTIDSINILSAEPIEGKVLWIVDDMVDTAGSVESLLRALALHKPAEVNIIAVHAVFSPPAAERLNLLSREGLLHRLIVTDTVFHPSSALGENIRLEVVPSAELSAKIIRTMVTKSSMNKLLRTFDAAIYLNSPNLFNAFQEAPVPEAPTGEEQFPGS